MPERPPEARGPSRKFQIELARRIREREREEQRRLENRLADLGPVGLYVLIQEARRHGHKAQNPRFKKQS